MEGPLGPVPPQGLSWPSLGTCWPEVVGTGGARKTEVQGGKLVRQSLGPPNRMPGTPEQMPLNQAQAPPHLPGSLKHISVFTQLSTAPPPPPILRQPHCCPNTDDSEWVLDARA